MPTESVALFTIQRDAGAFTAVTVSWEVTTAGSGANISPTSGTVDFGEGQQSGTFEIQALPDEVWKAGSSILYILNVYGKTPTKTMSPLLEGRLINMWALTEVYPGLFRRPMELLDSVQQSV